MVGQGITGTLLAHALLEKGKTVQIFDNNYVGSSSKVAAGIINPVTGRRIVKGWLIDELIPVAKTFYERLEKLLGENFYHQKNVLRVLFSIKEENLWLEKTGDELVEKYVIEANDYGLFKNKITEGEALGEVQYSAQVDMPLLLEKSKEYFSNHQMMNVELFDYEQVIFKNGKVFYKNIEAEKILFCEGHQAKNNPWFGNLPFEVAKGEVLLIKIPGANFDKILKHKLFIVPLPNDIYWIGATYEWDDLDELPTEKEKQSLIKKLDKILTVPYEIIDHQAAIRPTTFDRRPFLGLHPENSCLGIVNGMGTKGASLAPYFVHQFVDFLFEEKSINSEADIERHQSKV
ncbi:MAG: NAD(P)/FAD-dependent oxidoreductase [Saprospiraceae bacterium]